MMKRIEWIKMSAVLFCALWGSAALASLALQVQKKVMEDYGIKINALCDTNLSIEYDMDSLKKNNKDIEWGQTKGERECNEPLRYIWYACQSNSGKASVKKLGVSKIVCKGVSGNVGKLSKSGKAIVVERAYEEPKPYLRSLKQFQTAAGISIKPDNPDPYHDKEWSELRNQKNPVLDTKTYCLVDGQKTSFDKYQTIHKSHEYHKRNGAIKCWKDGNQVLDLTFKNGRKSGYLTLFEASEQVLENYMDGVKAGDEKIFKDGKIESHGIFQAENRVSTKKYFPNGKMKSYSRKVASGYARVDYLENGKLSRVDCKPEVRGDAILGEVCGFGKVSMVKTHDAAGKVKNTYVFKDGLMQSRQVGDSDLAIKSEAKFSDGKRDGPENLFSKDGKLSSTIVWKDGAKNGPEKFFHSDGKKVVKVVNWNNNVMIDMTEFYLNGNPKLKETYTDLDDNEKKRKKEQRYYDSGQLSYEGSFTACPSRSYQRWCEEGIYRVYYDNGTLREETSYKNGERSGTSKTWLDNGKLWKVEEYVDGKIRSKRSYDLFGNLIESEEYEEDGSKKL